MIDPAAVTAIDVHVHTALTRSGHDPMPPELRDAARRSFRSDQALPGACVACKENAFALLGL